MDIPSFSYQFSFEQSPDWSRTYAPGRELKAYADHCVDKYGLGAEDPVRHRGGRRGVRRRRRPVARRPSTAGDEITARFLVNAIGVLNIPKLPDIAGVDSFAGVTMHTARWDHSQDLTGKRVAIIGTGASAVQVIPEIAPIVEHLTVFQRTPIWCFPKLDVPAAGVRRAGPCGVPGGMACSGLLSQAYVEVTFTLSAQYYTVFPHRQALPRRWAGRIFAGEVHDPEVRDKLTPRYAVGCKRPGFHNTYLSTYNRDNVRLVTEPIEKVIGTGVATTDGEIHEVDVLILATGFKVMDVDAADVRRHRARRPVTGRVLGQEPDAGLRGRQRPGLPELLQRLRTVRLRRLVVFRAHRDPDPPHRAVPEAGASSAGRHRSR